jgi:hypothetical protein
MQSAKRLVGVALVLGLSLSLGACGTKVRLSSKLMCEAHGGTYSAQQQHCSYTQKTLSARAVCEQQGGMYLPAEQYCELQAGQ